jgi:hypothetical protein
MCVSYFYVLAGILRNPRQAAMKVAKPHLLHRQQRLEGIAGPNAHFFSVMQVKLAASSVLPLPLYRATCGYAQSGRARRR